MAAIGPFRQWSRPGRIVSLDPFGHMVTELFATRIAAGLGIRPTIAVTCAQINLPESADALRAGRLHADGDVRAESGSVRVRKIAIEPVRWLPGVAHRFGIEASTLRRALFEHTGGMVPELVTRPDLEMSLPPGRPHGSGFAGPRACFVAGLWSGRLPDRVACQRPGQPTIARVGLAPTR